MRAVCVVSGMELVGTAGVVMVVPAVVGWLCCRCRQPSPLPPDKIILPLPSQVENKVHLAVPSQVEQKVNLAVVSYIEDEMSVISVSDNSDSIGSLMEDSGDVLTGILVSTNKLFSWYFQIHYSFIFCYAFLHKYVYFLLFNSTNDCHLIKLNILVNPVESGISVESLSCYQHFLKICHNTRIYNLKFKHLD